MNWDDLDEIDQQKLTEMGIDEDSWSVIMGMIEGYEEEELFPWDDTIDCLDPYNLDVEPDCYEF